ncbi:hypothetical protein ACS0TY_032577 [Phlomoides rotata]
MEVAKISLLEKDDNNNKENIPSFSSAKKPGPDNQKLKCASVKINKRRRPPLRDITNLYRADLGDLTLLSSDLSSNGRRKLVDDSSEHSNILRRDFGHV